MYLEPTIVDKILVVTGNLPFRLAPHFLSRLGDAEPILPNGICVEVNSDANGFVWLLRIR